MVVINNNYWYDEGVMNLSAGHWPGS